MPTPLEIALQEIEKLKKELASRASTAASSQSVAGGRDIRDSIINTGHLQIVQLTDDNLALNTLLGPAPTPAERRRCLKDYLTFLHDKHLYVDFRGIGIAENVPLRIPLEDLYVPLNARIEMPDGETWARDLQSSGRPLPPEDLEAIGKRFSNPMLVEKLFSEHVGLVILGDPGSGKTTFLKHLAVLYATGRGASKRLPVFLPLAAYANRLAEKATALADYLSQYFVGEGIADVAPEFRRALDKGTALILLDGLDEVKDPVLRKKVVDQVGNLFLQNRHAGNKLVITSRIIGYREVRPNLPGLDECTLVDFDLEDIKSFASRWTRAVEQASKGSTTAAQLDAGRLKAELISAVEDNPGVRRLATNPLLLTILALMQKAGIPFPDRRAELYAKCLETMLSTWNRARGVGKPRRLELDNVTSLKILAPLALWMHEDSKGFGLVKHADMLRELQRILLVRAVSPRAESEATQRERDDAETMATEFLQDVREFCGVLLERGESRYGFLHLTFEEYLAGVGLTMVEDRPGEFGKPLGFDAVVEESRRRATGTDAAAWREPLLLAVGYLGLVQNRESAAAELVTALLNTPGSGSESPAILAGDAVADVGQRGVGKACWDRTVERMSQLMTDSTVTPKIRAAAGKTLSRLGDPRRGVAPRTSEELAEIEFCYVPPGRFWFGKSNDGNWSDSLSSGFWISRFPVTNGQFRIFAEDSEGWKDPRWWKVAAEAGCWRNCQVKATDWDGNNPRWATAPEALERPFDGPSQPRVMTNWFEAAAFAAWLTDRLRRLDLIPTKMHFRLPTEFEWEKAARGGDKIPQPPQIRTLATGLSSEGFEKHRITDNPDPKREYPWNGDFDKQRANWAEMEIGATSTVGCFPLGQSPCGAEEMAGNVWEWTSSWYDLSNPKYLVVRGGSWADVYPGNLRAACRGNYVPGRRRVLIGFRLVCVGGSP